MFDKQSVLSQSGTRSSLALDPNPSLQQYGGSNPLGTDTNQFRNYSSSSAQVSATVAPNQANYGGNFATGDVVADFNRDGFSDILWRNYATGENTIWVMNGTNAVNAVYLPTVTDLNWKISATGDLNRDGFTDIVWRNYATGENTIWVMNNTVAVNAISLATVTDTAWGISAVGDLNLDGSSDILWRNYATGENTIWVMNGTNAVNAISLPTVTDVNWKISGTGDFSRDGQLDILWRNYSTGENSIWRLRGTEVSGFLAVATVTDTNWYTGGIGDFNRDGNVDILWRNNSAGHNTVWTMNANNAINATSLARITDTSWRLGVQTIGSGGSTGRADLLGTYFNATPEPLFSGETFTVDVDISNLGNRSTGSSFRVSFYLSSNSTISSTDYLLGSATIGSLNAGATDAFSVNLSLPGFTNSFWFGDGTYYIGMIIDSNDAIAESNENNNRNRGELLDYDGVFITV
jgi:hypothetical protein